MFLVPTIQSTAQPAIVPSLLVCSTTIRQSMCPPPTRYSAPCVVMGTTVTRAMRSTVQKGQFYPKPRWAGQEKGAPWRDASILHDAFRANASRKIGNDPLTSMAGIGGNFITERPEEPARPFIRMHSKGQQQSQLR